MERNYRIKNIKEYEEFRKIYGIFMEYPFYEAWTEEQFAEEYEYLKNNGEIFGCYGNTENIFGLIALVYGAKNTHPVEFENPDKVMYISDIAVLNEYRGNGIGNYLADFAISYTELLNYYNEMYLRTNLENSMSEGIFARKGFEIVRKDGLIVTEDVYFPRTNSSISDIDKRKFLTKKLVK